MTEEKKDRYNIEKLPISDKTRDGLTPENINYIGAIGRMLSLQDEFIEQTYEDSITKTLGLVGEMIKEQNEAIFSKINEQNKIIKQIQRLIFDINEELKNHESRIKKLEGRVEKMFLEHRSNHPIN
jgi:uncharacterized protein Yka (UPF0111/DUF47 family)